MRTEMLPGISKRILTAAAVCCLGAGLTVQVRAAGENEGTVITVEYPGDGQDASPAIQSAIAKAKRVDGPVTIQFEADKEYEVWPETAYHTTGYYVSNSATRGENPNGERWSAILLKNMEDVTIDGNDSLMLVHGVMTPILIDNSEDITFKDFHLDYVRPTVSEFTVIEKGTDYVKVQVHEDSLYELQDTNGDGNADNIRWVGEPTLADENARYWSSNATLMQEYDPVNETLRRIGMYGYGSTITDLGENVLRFDFPGGSSYHEGCTYQVRDGIRNQVGTFIHRSKNVTLEDCGFHYMHGLGIVGQYSENLTFTRLECAPREETGRTVASFADFVQISGCRGDVVISDSHFSGSHDDTFNIHGTHLRIVEVNEAEQKIKVRFMHNQSWGFQAFEKGDEIEFINGSTLIPYQRNAVKDWTRINDTDIELTLEDPLPPGIQQNYDAVENITWTPNVTIKNNLSEYVPTRGVLCTTRGKVVIEGNTFKKQGMASVLLEDDARGWFESGLIRDMTIKDNTFIDCASPQIHSNPQTAVLDPEQTVHSNITVAGNTFTGQAVNISAICTKNFTVTDNQFPEAGGSISLNSCNGVEIHGNENQTRVSSSNSVNEKSLNSFSIDAVRESEEISREGMTASANSEWPGDGGSNPPFPAQYVLDGNADTFWSTDWVNIPEDDIAIEFDLNGEKTFNELSYLPRVSETHGRILKYEIYAAGADGTYGTEPIARGSWADSADEKYADFDTVTTGKIKLVVKETSMSWDNKKVVYCSEIGFHNSSRSAGELPVGKKAELNTSAAGENGMPSDLSEAAFTYRSSDEKIASVDERGVITAKTPGTAEITVTVSAYGTVLSDSVSLTVTEETYAAAEKIEIREIGGEAGTELQLSAEVTPGEAAGDVRWKIEDVSSASGAKADIDPLTGMLNMTGEGRVTVTAYSDNDPAVSDTVDILFRKEEIQTTKDWEWIRENPSAHWIDGNGDLNIALEQGVIWVNNTAKNILTVPVEEENFEVVTKMNYKPQGDYAEAGLILYADDSNYVVLTRKAHSGYRPGSLNIYSMIARVDGNPWESPAENLVLDNEGGTVYLKVVKEGDLYSGYYSADGEEWFPIYENKEADLGAAPKAGLIGYVVGSSETAVFEEFSVNGEQYPLEELGIRVSAEEARITSVVPGGSRKVTAGTVFESLRLPETVQVIWNGKYEEAVPVVWNSDGYTGESVGTCTLTGTLKGIREEALETEERPGVRIIVTADKSALENAVCQAENRIEQAYTEETWAVLQEALAESRSLLERDDASQEATDAAAGRLESALQNLEPAVSYAEVKELLGSAEELTAQTVDMLYEETQPEEERINGYYSSEKRDALVLQSRETADLLERWKDLEAIGNVDDLLDEEEKLELIGKGTALVDALEIFGDSRVTVATDALERLLEEAAQLNGDNFTEESWTRLQEAADGARAVLESGVYSRKDMERLEQEVAEAMDQLKTEELPYVDVYPGDYFYDAAESLYEKGIMTGMDETHFGPTVKLARAQFVTILYRMAGSPEVSGKADFADVPGNAWFADAVAWAVENGVVTGYSNGNFGPSDLVTREQIAAMLYRYDGNAEVPDGAELPGYPDAGQISDFAREAMIWAVEKGIITGQNYGTILAPQDTAYRAEAAVMIDRYLG